MRKFEPDRVRLPSKRKAPRCRGGLLHDGSWEPRANPEGEPLDFLTRMLDGLCASRRRADRTYTPRDFALRIASTYGHLVQQPEDPAACVFNDLTMAGWMKLDKFSDWLLAPSRTLAERTIICMGVGPMPRSLLGPSEGEVEAQTPDNQPDRPSEDPWGLPDGDGEGEGPHGQG
jgi:hypothetical protein